MGLFDRVREKWDEAGERRRERIAAKNEYLRRLGALGLEGSPAEAVAGLIPLRESAGVDRSESARLEASTFRRVAEDALADDLLSRQEEERLLELGEALGIDQQQLRGEFGDLLHRLVVARVNDGRMPELSPDDVSLMLKKGERAHAVMDAELMKEVAVREYQAGHSGFSFRVAKGVRYHTGSTRGRSVVVGTRLVAQDVGTLTITSQRCVFAGSKKTLEFAYPKLLDLKVFTDGIRFHVSNRQTASLFRVESGDVVAAMVNGAAQLLD